MLPPMPVRHEIKPTKSFSSEQEANKSYANGMAYRQAEALGDKS
jgi:hypothetical protein